MDVWTESLSNIALPSSLTELAIVRLWDEPLPVLPPLLQVLRIGGLLNQSPVGCTAALPTRASADWLYRAAAFGKLFASTPHLEELYLGDGSRCQVAMDVLPRSLLMLRVGKDCS